MHAALRWLLLTSAFNVNTPPSRSDERSIVDRYPRSVSKRRWRNDFRQIRSLPPSIRSFSIFVSRSPTAGHRWRILMGRLTLDEDVRFPSSMTGVWEDFCGGILKFFAF